MWITAAVMAEICSALPLSGSIYIWAAESAGPKYARFFGFIVAWWSCTAWMTFAAGNCLVRCSSIRIIISTLTQVIRRLPITSCHRWLCGTSTFRVVLETTTSNGVLSCGPSPKAVCCSPLLSTTCRLSGIPVSSSFLSHYI